MPGCSSPSTARPWEPPDRDADADTARRLPLVLLREFQHRSANLLHFANLQLEVHARRSASDVSKAAFQEVSASFRQMIEAQKCFVAYEPDSVADAAVEVGQTCAALARAYATARPGIRFDWVASEVAGYAVRPAGDLSLIVNELVTNAYKHAFGRRDGGHLRVVLAPSGHGRACLSVVDDGPGIDKPFSAGGTGMGLVEALAKAIDGEVSTSGAGGSEYRVRVTFSIEAV